MHDFRAKRLFDEGFTLIELLVVIAVIGMLLAIITPALRNARQAAQRIVCASQMKQWSLATLAYTAEHDHTIPVYSDVCDTTNGQNALDPETYWYNRLARYLTDEYQGTWGMDYKRRRCPSARANWGEHAVWVGVFFGKYNSNNAPFIQPFEWTGSEMIPRTNTVKLSSIKLPAAYLMLLDVKRDVVFDPIYWAWSTDFDGDGKADSHPGVLSSSTLGAYNSAQPKIHRGGCNVALFDGHVEWIGYDIFWEIGDNGFPVHSYWYNQNRP